MRLIPDSFNLFRHWLGEVLSGQECKVLPTQADQGIKIKGKSQREGLDEGKEGGSEISGGIRVGTQNPRH